MHFHQHSFTLETLFIYCKAVQATDSYRAVCCNCLQLHFYFLLSDHKRVKSTYKSTFFLKSSLSRFDNSLYGNSSTKKLTDLIHQVVKKCADQCFQKWSKKFWGTSGLKYWISIILGHPKPIRVSQICLFLKISEKWVFHVLTAAETK